MCRFKGPRSIDAEKEDDIMATYNNLKKGGANSKEEVQRLQQALIDAGYDLGSYGADGVYGAKTEAAVRLYQENAGLAKDGIAGEKTQGSLFGGASASPTANQSVNQGVSWSGQMSGVSPNTSGNLSRYSAGYSPSSQVNAAYQQLQNQLANKPGPFSSKYEDELKAIYDKIMGREKFTYDLGSDLLYQQYKDQYTRQGKLAMMDTMGNAAALTGGYGSSYASTAGNQAYQAYLAQLNERVPELHNAALNRYQAEGEEMYNRYGLAKGLYDDDYGKYRDTVGDYYSDLNYYDTNYRDERSHDYNTWSDMLNYWTQQQEAERDQANWAAEFAYQQQQDQLAQSNWEREFSQKGKGSSSGSGGKEREVMELSEAMKAVGQESVINGRDAAIALAQELMATGVVETSETRSMSVIKEILEEAASGKWRY